MNATNTPDVSEQLDTEDQATPGKPEDVLTVDAIVRDLADRWALPEDCTPPSRK